MIERMSILWFLIPIACFLTPVVVGYVWLVFRIYKEITS